MATNNMPKFLEDYVTVNELIKKMNEVYPRGRMISEIEYYGDDFVVFKSSFYETNEETYPKATGFARQHKSEHKSWFEMAETKSRGRCLRIVFSEDTVAEEMVGIAPSKYDKQVSQGVASVMEGKSEEKSSDILGDAAKKQDEVVLPNKTHIIKAYAHNLKEKCMELVGDDKASAKELYERALQEVGIIEAELNHKNSQDMQYEIKKQLDSLNK
tara:strand:+ start:314 stop:955 length:642 start_codon:yes stop_codon:yes gene_type:complete